MLNSTDPSSVVASMRAAVDVALKNIVDWGVDAVEDHPVFYIHDELAAAFPHATVPVDAQRDRLGDPPR